MYSSNYWSDTSDIVNPNPPCLYGILFPTEATKQMLDETNQKMVDVFDSTKINQIPPTQTDFTSYLHLANANVSKYSSSSTSQIPTNSQSEIHTHSNETSTIENKNVNIVDEENNNNNTNNNNNNNNEK